MTFKRPGQTTEQTTGEASEIAKSRTALIEKELGPIIDRLDSLVKKYQSVIEKLQEDAAVGEEARAELSRVLSEVFEADRARRQQETLADIRLGNSLSKLSDKPSFDTSRFHKENTASAEQKELQGVLHMIKDIRVDFAQMLASAGDVIDMDSLIEDFKKAAEDKLNKLERFLEEAAKTFNL